MAAVDELLLPGVPELLAHVAAPDPSPGAGAVAAVVTSLAAGVIAGVAASSPEWPESRAARAQARRLLDRALRLAPRNEAAFLEALAALNLPERVEPEVRSAAIRDALARSTAVPLRIAEVAADTAELAAHVAERCEPTFRADAVAALRLAEGATRACTELVATNLGVTDDDERLAKARRLAESAAEAARLVASAR
jgi:formiminotetrahydrofolate cyclodeaminase